ncbi:efflux RND transporter permease subunit, partial [Klebsiella pneumoniae]|nr:efflux RND transporter permease subunit [Klebsiella pneumoniae]
TFVPALIAIAVTGRVKESDNLAVRRLKSCYAPLLKRTINRPLAAIATGVVLFLGALLLFFRLGQEFIPTLDEK